MEEGQRPHVAVFPSIGLGHMIPLAEFAKVLFLRHGFSVTFISISDPLTFPPKAHDAFLHSLPSGVNFVTLPPVDLPDDMHIVTRIFRANAGSLPALRDVVQDLRRRTRLVAFVMDPFGTDFIDLSKGFGVPPFLFFTSNLLLLSLMLELPRFLEPGAEVPDLWELPGCVPLHLSELPDHVQEKKGEAFEDLARHCARYSELQGILVNSFEEIEPETAAILTKTEPGRRPVQLIGPLVNDGSGASMGFTLSDECLKWLDKQPARTVVYVSLGSMGLLTHEQTKEIALGLELSGQRFLWVVRCPVDKDQVKGMTISDDPFDYLPQGFTERTKDLGFFVPDWAPQASILKNGSVGAFLTHCGWNSFLESIVHGDGQIGLIAWPLYSEQMMNASMLVKGAKAALRPEAAAEDWVMKKEEVARVVKELMEEEGGRAVRRRVQELGEAARNSSEALAEVVNKWKD